MNFRALFRFRSFRRATTTRPAASAPRPQLILETLEGRWAAGDVLVSIAGLASILAPARDEDSSLVARPDTSITATIDLTPAPPPAPLIPHLNAILSGPAAASTPTTGTASQAVSPTNPLDPLLPEIAGLSTTHNASQPYTPPTHAENPGGTAGAGPAGGSAAAPPGPAPASGGARSQSNPGQHDSAAAHQSRKSGDSERYRHCRYDHDFRQFHAAHHCDLRRFHQHGDVAHFAHHRPFYQYKHRRPGPSHRHQPFSRSPTDRGRVQSLTILSPGYTSSSTPTITIVGDSTMNFYVTPVHIDIDYQHDGAFGDAGDRSVPVQVISIGGINDNKEVLTLPQLAPGTWNVRARAGAASALTSIHLDTPDPSSQEPVTFQPNLGQTTPGVNFVSLDADYTAYTTSNGLVLSLPNEGAGTSDLQLQVVKALVSGETTQELNPAPGLTNYLLGNDSNNWVTNIPNYGSVQYNNIYPQVNLTYLGNHGDLEYQFTVLPGNSPSAIILGFTIGSSPSNVMREILPDGDLLLLDTSTYNVVVLPAPTIYQIDSQGNHVPVQGGYQIQGGYVVFSVGSYDASENLIIDPTLEFSTYFGGGSGATSFDSGQGVAADSAGDTYIAGYTTSVGSGDFPLTSTTLPASENGNVGSSGGTTSFVAEFGPTGGQIYTTFRGAPARTPIKRRTLSPSTVAAMPTSPAVPTRPTFPS